MVSFVIVCGFFGVFFLVGEVDCECFEVVVFCMMIGLMSFCLFRVVDIFFGFVEFGWVMVVE